MHLKLRIVILFCIGMVLTSTCGDSDVLRKYTENLPFDMPCVTEPQFPNFSVNISDFGAVGDGHTMNTQAIADAIENCLNNGGGTVLVPQGIWLTGPFQLRNNINLHLKKGAVLLFSSRFEDYQLIESNWEGQKQVRCISPISAFNLENIAITGEGIIDGSGDAWRPVKKFKMTDRQWNELLASGGAIDAKGNTWWPSEAAMNGAALIRELSKNPPKNIKEYAAAREYLRPVLVNLVNCKGVLLDGPTFQNSPAWNIHPLMCENMIIRNINVRNPWYSQNGDGIDLESCRNIILYNSRFDVGDDAICLKSGRDEVGRRRGKPTENVVIDGCTVYHGHGGFTVGSEMSGGVRNISVINCTFLGTDVGLRFKSTRGRGGVVENIYISNIYMKDIPAEAIRFNMFYDNLPPIPEEEKIKPLPYLNRPLAPVSEETPKFRNIEIKNIYCRGAEQAVLLQGLPEMTLSKLIIDNLIISAKKGLVCVDTEDLVLKNIHIATEKGPVIACYNSKKIEIDNIYKPDIDGPLVTINGNKTGKIKIRQVNGFPDENLIDIGDEVSPEEISWK
jgi:hypothetical protein